MRPLLLTMMMMGCFDPHHQRDGLLFADPDSGVGGSGGGLGAGGGSSSGGGTAGGSTCSAPSGTSWVARPLFTLGSPIPDPTGVGCAGNDLWLVNTSQDSKTQRLVRYSTITGQFSFDHTLTGLVETSGSRVFGLTIVGSSIWLSVSGIRNQLVEIDATTGAVGRVIGSPTVLGPSDLATDGHALIVSTGTGEVYRVTLDPVPLTTRLVKTTGILDRDIGVSALGSEWLVAGLFGSLQTYASSGDFTGEVRLPGGASFERPALGALCVQQNRLFMLGTAGIGVYELCNARP